VLVPVAAITDTVADPAVTQRKFERELAQWRANEVAYRRRGWLLVQQAELTATVCFTAKVGSATGPLSVVAAAARFDFTNYDLWPPSVTFVDPMTGDPQSPPVRAWLGGSGLPQDVLVEGHPDTGLPFLCVPGTREYHSHPQHSGDSWLIHRSRSAGALASLSDVIWRSMVLNIIGLRTTVQSIPVTFGPQAQYQVEVRLQQGDVESLAAAAASGLNPDGS
jgi:hypothetical protein